MFGEKGGAQVEGERAKKRRRPACTRLTSSNLAVGRSYTRAHARRAVILAQSRKRRTAEPPLERFGWMAAAPATAASRVRTTNRYSALQSLIADQDTDIEDELARGTFPRLPLPRFASPCSAVALPAMSGAALHFSSAWAARDAASSTEAARP